MIAEVHSTSALDVGEKWHDKERYDGDGESERVLVRVVNAHESRERAHGHVEGQGEEQYGEHSVRPMFTESAGGSLVNESEELSEYDECAERLDDGVGAESYQDDRTRQDPADESGNRFQYRQEDRDVFET